MQISIQKLAAISILLMALAGCKSGNYHHYTAPEITGRVLSADTHEPLARVRLRRVELDGTYEPFGPVKGGQLMLQPAPVVTGADGRFVLPAQSVFAVLRKPGWWTAPVSYQLAGYQTFSTNYTAANVISNTPAGAPVVDAGDVLLTPADK